MDFFDWSKGCVYLVSYVDIVSVYTEGGVLQSYCFPVERKATVSPENHRCRDLCRLRHGAAA